ncbi:MAG: sortase [Clostridiales bacterium]|nr:sortase [Clostridiales bacterium]
MRELEKWRQRLSACCQGKSARRCGRAFLVIGAAMLLAALGMEGRNVWETRQAGRESGQIYEQLEAVMDALAENSEDSQETAALPSAEEAEGEMLDANAYIGILRIPEFDLNLPVQREWSYPALRQTPCRFTGSVEDEDLVICAHNYSTHFGKLRSLQEGAQVTFEEIGGTIHYYQVARVEILGPTDIEALLEGDWPLTLLTCTYGGENRVVVRCR